MRVEYPDGTKERRTGTARNMTEARAAVRQAQEDAHAGRRAVNERLTVGQMVTEYMEGRAQDWAQRTAWNNEKLYTRYIQEELGPLRAAGIDPKRLRAYFTGLKDKGLGDSARRQVYSLLRGAYKRAVMDGLLRDNPTLHAKPGRSKEAAPKLKHFTPEELGRFIEAAREDRDALSLAFIAMTGLRLGEALALTWGDVGQDEAGHPVVNVTKTRSDFEGKAYTNTPKTAKGKRVIPLHGDALEVLEEMRGHIATETRIHGKVWKGKTGPLFPSPSSGEYLRQDRAREVMYQTCERVGLPVLAPHALRHSAGTFLISRGADPVTVAALLGHAQVSTTLNIYAHALPDKLRGLAFGLDDLRGKDDPAKEEGQGVKRAARPRVSPRRGKGGPRRKV